MNCSLCKAQDLPDTESNLRLATLLVISSRRQWQDACYALWLTRLPVSRRLRACSARPACTRALACIPMLSRTETACLASLPTSMACGFPYLCCGTKVGGRGRYEGRERGRALRRKESQRDRGRDIEIEGRAEKERKREKRREQGELSPMPSSETISMILLHHALSRPHP